MSENNFIADKLLKAIQEEERDKTRGRLKIFFGYAAGVGLMGYRLNECNDKR